jgi:uncharacterized LabA/DUF88 family protein
MERVAIFVDAGYLFAQGSTLIAGTKLKRSETKLDEVKALALFEALAKQLTGLPLLRTYWYDGTSSGPSPAHVSLAFRPNVKVRLGIVNSHGEQKGVDSLIVSDLMNLSRNRAIADAVLVTGDEDIRVGVQQAQEVGVRVHLVGLEPAARNQSFLLRQEADTQRELSKAEVLSFLTQVVAPLAPAVPAVVAGATASLDAVANQVAMTLPKPDLERVLKSPKGIPPDVDQQLLSMARATKGSSLVEQEKRDLRKRFVVACKARP